MHTTFFAEGANRPPYISAPQTTAPPQNEPPIAESRACGQGEEAKQSILQASGEAGQPNPMKKQPFPLQTGLLVALGSFVMGYLFINWVFFGDGFAVTAFTLLFVLWVEKVFRTAGRVAGRDSTFWLCILLATAASFSLLSNDSLLFGCNILFLCATAAYWVVCRGDMLVAGRTSAFLPLDGWHALLGYPFANFFTRWKWLVTALHTHKGKRKKRYVAVLTTVAAGVPVVWLAMAILLRVDEGFSRLVEDILRRLPQWQFGLSRDWCLMLLLSLPVGAYFAGLLYGAVGKGENCKAATALQGRAEKMRLAPAPALAAVLTALCALYLLFFAVQASYLFSAFSGQLPAGFTVAQYARSGFFELCQIALLNLGVIGVAAKISEAPVRKNPLLQGLSLALCGFTLLFILISFSKMYLYMGRFGLTPRRLMVSWAMVVILVVNSLCAATLVRPLPAVRWSIMVCGVACCLLCLMGTDHIIARNNVARYQAGQLEEEDMRHLIYQSEAGYLAVRQLVEEGNLPPAAEAMLRDELQYWYDYSPFGWKQNLESFFARQKRQATWPKEGT